MQTVAALVVLEASRKRQSLSHHHTSMDWLCWWHNHTAHVVPPPAILTFVAKMSEKCKSISQSAIQVKNWQKIISTEEKLYIISQELKVCVARLPQFYWNGLYQTLWMEVSYIFITLKIKCT